VVEEAQLTGVQLHGEETAAFILEMKARLPPQRKIRVIKTYWSTTTSKIALPKFAPGLTISIPYCWTQVEAADEHSIGRRRNHFWARTKAFDSGRRTECQ